MDEWTNEMASQMTSDLSSSSSMHARADAGGHILGPIPASNLAPQDHVTLRLGEKSESALGRQTGQEADLQVEASIEKEIPMAFNPNQVPQDISDAERTKAMAKVKDVDSKAAKGAEEDIINTGVKKNGYVLWHIRKRGGKKDEKTGRKPVIAQDLMWLPHAVDSSLDEFVSYFARKYGQSDKAAGETVFKDRSLQAEVINLRSKMAPKVKAPGAKRGKFRS